ncbi:discoidin domain-containing protein [Streptomyces sp. AK02-04a]|uniref:discoidin domain-containing protein n=1 Tax=Streptomyces sp. AK02-04a TaxID=3028649 RepID=UPI0029B2198E|nr:discoidin domain-containing protein [Streptomyces sp. AK02-04a]MDX3763856.1 discoidin domain-containing protein [Streptomyces sp. AK02-04a]
MNLKLSRFSLAAAFGAVVACLLVMPVAAMGSLTYLGKTSDMFTVHDVGRLVNDPRDAFFVPYQGNPVVGGPNLYSPNPVKGDGVWHVYFGGWLAKGQGNDEIYLATNRDDTLTSGFSSARTVIGHGVYVHVNDPSTVKRPFGWVMAMTTAVTGTGGDRCSVLSSGDGVRWPQLTDHRHEVVFRGAHVAKCARPSLIWNAEYGHGAGRWELYFDGTVNNGPAYQQHLAVSREAIPRHFTYLQRIGSFVEGDIRRQNGHYIAAYRRTQAPRPWRLHYATSTDGLHFTDHGELLAPDPLAAGGYDRCGVNTPGWAINEKGRITALMYAGTADCHFNDHKLGVALPQSATILFTGRVAHVHRQAVNATVQRLDTHRYKSVDRIQVIDRPGSASRIDQTVAGNGGDAWSAQARSYTPLPRRSAVASSVAPGAFAASNAIDGTPATSWSSARGPANRTEWIRIDLGTAQPIRRVVLTPRHNGWGFPIDFALQTSNDGTMFTNVRFQQYTGFTNPGSSRVPLAFAAPVKARYVRVLATTLGTDAHGTPYFQLAEVSPQK